MSKSQHWDRQLRKAGLLRLPLLTSNLHILCSKQRQSTSSSNFCSRSQILLRSKTSCPTTLALFATLFLNPSSLIQWWPRWTLILLLPWEWCLKAPRWCLNTSTILAWVSLTVEIHFPSTSTCIPILLSSSFTTILLTTQWWRLQDFLLPIWYTQPNTTQVRRWHQSHRCFLLDTTIRIRICLINNPWAINHQLLQKVRSLLNRQLRPHLPNLNLKLFHAMKRQRKKETTRFESKIFCLAPMIDRPSCSRTFRTSSSKPKFLIYSTQPLKRNMIISTCQLIWRLHATMATLSSIWFTHCMSLLCTRSSKDFGGRRCFLTASQTK